VGAAVAPPPPPEPARHDAGSGPVSAIFGVAVFLGFLLFAVQVTAHLWATSAVTAAAFDAARLVAGERSVTATAAASHLEAILGEYGQRVTLDWSGSTPDEVVLRVWGPTPAALIRSVGGLAGLDGIDRTVRVRRERVS